MQFSEVLVNLWRSWWQHSNEAELYEPVHAVIKDREVGRLYVFRKPARGDFIEPKNVLDEDMREGVVRLERLGDETRPCFERNFRHTSWFQSGMLWRKRSRQAKLPMKMMSRPGAIPRIPRLEKGSLSNKFIWDKEGPETWSLRLSAASDGRGYRQARVPGFHSHSANYIRLCSDAQCFDCLRLPCSYRLPVHSKRVDWEVTRRHPS